MKSTNSTAEKVIKIDIPNCYLEHVKTRFEQITMLLGKERAINYIRIKLKEFPKELEEILKRT